MSCFEEDVWTWKEKTGENIQGDAEIGVEKTPKAQVPNKQPDVNNPASNTEKTDYSLETEAVRNRTAENLRKKHRTAHRIAETFVE